MAKRSVVQARAFDHVYDPVYTVSNNSTLAQIHSASQTATIVSIEHIPWHADQWLHTRVELDLFSIPAMLLYAY